MLSHHMSLINYNDEIDDNSTNHNSTNNNNDNNN